MEAIKKEHLSLNKWKEEVLKHCQSGINEANLFIEANPAHYLINLEQIKQEFYAIINCLE